MLYSQELGSTRAKYTVQLGQSNNFLYTVSYQQKRTWSLSSEGNQSKSLEKVQANWNCLSLVTSHVVSTSRAEHTTSFISYHQLKTWSLLTKDNQSKSWEKVRANWNCLSLFTSHVVSTSRAEHTTSYMSYKQMKTLSSFTTRQPIQILKKKCDLCFFVIDHFSCH